VSLRKKWLHAVTKRLERIKINAQLMALGLEQTHSLAAFKVSTTKERGLIKPFGAVRGFNKRAGKQAESLDKSAYGTRIF